MKRETEAAWYRSLFMLGFVLLAFKLYAFSEPIHVEVDYHAAKDAFVGDFEKRMEICNQYMIDHQDEIEKQYHAQLERDREAAESVRRSEEHHERCAREFNEKIDNGWTPEEIINFNTEGIR